MIRPRLRERHERGVGEQLVGQRLQAGFAGDHALGAPAWLVGQIDVFQLLLGGCAFHGRAQLGCELALLVDALHHRGAALFEFTQVTEAGLEVTQLGVVEVVGGFLAVAGNEGHRGTTIQQLHGCIHLGRPNLQFGGQLQKNLVQNQGPVAGRKGKAVGVCTRSFAPDAR